MDKMQSRQCSICEKFHHPTDDSEERICSDCHVGFRFFRDDIMTLKRAILYLKECDAILSVDTIVHGVDCVKDEHTVIQWSKDNDKPFNVGIVKYCGRCYSQL